MSRLRYGVPYWLDRFPASRRPAYPRHRGHLDVTVAIVGGGLTGCSIAYAFAAAGVDVALFESARVGCGATARSLGLLTTVPAVPFRETRATHGLRAARHVWQAARRAALDGTAALRRLGVACDLELPGAVHVASVAEALPPLRREYLERRGAACDASWATEAVLARELALAQPGGIRSDAGQIDPFRACIGLARAAAARGAAIFERSPVLRVRGGRRAVDIRTASGTVRAGRVVIATGSPGVLFKPLVRHFRLRHRFAVLTPPLPAAVRRETGPGHLIVRDTGQPPHWLRWTRDDRILFSGADRPPLPSRQRPKVLVQRTAQLMYELSLFYPAISGLQPEYAWDLPVYNTRDGLPVIGAHRSYGRHLFALGAGDNGAGAAHLAARVLLRQFLGEPARGDEVFGFERILDS